MLSFTANIFRTTLIDVAQVRYTRRTWGRGLLRGGGGYLGVPLSKGATIRYLEEVGWGGGLPGHFLFHKGDGKLHF